jgi:carboxyl-terminal processing protease
MMPFMAETSSAQRLPIVTSGNSTVMRKSSIWKFFIALPVAMSFTLGGASKIHGDSSAYANPAAQDGRTKFIAQVPSIRAAQVSPDAVYRKVWRLIKEDFYDQSYNSQDWNRWEHRYDGKIKTSDDAHKAIESMLASLGDRYTRFLDREAFDDERGQIEAKLYGVGIQIGMDKTQKVVVIAPIDNTPASKAGLLPGDEIAEINGKPTKGLSVEEAAKQIKGPKGTDVTLTLNRSSKQLKVTMKRDEIHINAISTSKMLDPEVAYIRLNSFISQDANKEMVKALTGFSSAKGLILDLRDNPGGLLSNAIEISNMFLEGRKDIVSTVDKDGYKASQKSDGRPIWNRPLVVLINSNSASASEIASGAMKDHDRATLVGQKSYGKGLVQGITRLEDGTGVNVTIARYLTPNDIDIHKKGITPDFVVDLTDKDYKEGKGPWWIDPDGPTAAAKRQPEDMKDTQLQKAMAVIHQKISGAPLMLGNMSATAPKQATDKQ